ncbi:MAG: barstar family protein [Oscillibacter sp.]|nr:barstar family protein [Oscillibacter sp.]
MAEVVLDGLELETPEDIHDLFAGTLALPEYYGRNLDALFDCLTDCQNVLVIRLRHQGALEDRLGPRGRALIRLLRQVAAENPLVTLFEE